MSEQPQETNKTSKKDIFLAFARGTIERFVDNRAFQPIQPENPPILDSVDELESVFTDLVNRFNSLPIIQEKSELLQTSRSTGEMLYSRVADRVAIETNLFNIFRETGTNLLPIGQSSDYLFESRKDLSYDSELEAAGMFSLEDERVNLNPEKVHTRETSLFYLYHFDINDEAYLVSETLLAHEENHRKLYAKLKLLSGSTNAALERVLNSKKINQKVVEEFLQIPAYATIFEAHARMVNFQMRSREAATKGMLDKKLYPTIPDQIEVDKAIDRMVLLRSFGFTQVQIAELINADFRNYRKNGRNQDDVMRYIDQTIDGLLLENNVTAEEQMKRYELNVRINRLKAAIIAREEVNNYDPDEGLGQDTRPPVVT